MNPQREPWMDDALCAVTDPDAFFPEHGDTHASDNAKKVCATCDVKNACLEYAITHRITEGIWGGRTYRTRRRIIEKLNKEQAA